MSVNQLYVLSSERRSSTQGNILTAIGSQVETRRQSLRDERDKTQRLQQDERAALLKKIDSLQSELSKIDSQIEGQKSRVKLTEDAVSRSQELVTQSYISKEQLQQKQADLLDQRNRLQTLERDHISIRRELSSQKSELASLPLRQQNQLAQIERSITVNLTTQVINAYGQLQMLQAGMLLDADVLQETRRLYEWVLEPLYSLTGKL